MEITRILKSDFEQIYNIMEEAFPENERRSKEGQLALFEDELYKIYSDKEKTVFIAFWELSEYVFIEHFASLKSQRGGGIGGIFLKAFLEMCGKPAVLEVEPPLNEISKRRIMFYKRNGFNLNEYFYIQPPLGKDRDELELKIMTYPNALSQSEFMVLKNEIYEKIYKLNI